MAKSVTRAIAMLVVNAVLFIVFFVVVTPLGVVLHLVRDPLRRRLQYAARSYWEPLAL